MRFKMAVLVLTWLIAHVTLAQGQYRFEHFSKKDGLGNDLAWSMAEDSLGYIWIQYFGTLTTFDGYNFKVYRYDENDSLRSALNFLIATLDKDDNKNIWVHPHKDNNPETLVKFNQSTAGFEKHIIDLGDAVVIERLFENNGTSVWLGTNGLGLYHHDFINRRTTRFQNLIAGHSGKKTLIEGIRDLGESLLLSTHDGIWLFDKKSKTFTRPSADPRDTSLLFSSPTRILKGNGDRKSTRLNSSHQ